MAGLIDTEPCCPHPSLVFQAENQAPIASPHRLPSIFSATPCSPSCKECLGHRPSVNSNPHSRTPFCRNLRQLCHLLQLSFCHTSIVVLDLILTCCSLWLCFFAMFSLPLVAAIPSPTQGKFREPQSAVDQDRPPMVFRRVNEALCSWLQLHTASQLRFSSTLSLTLLPSKARSKVGDGFHPCRAGSAVKESETGEAGSKCTTNSHKEAFFLQKLGRGSNYYINGQIWVLNLWEATSCCIEEMHRKCSTS